MRRTLFSLAVLATLALAACQGSPTDTAPGGARFDGVIGSGTRAEDDAASAEGSSGGMIGSGTRSSDGNGTGFLGGGTRAESDTTSRGGGTIGSGT